MSQCNPTVAARPRIKRATAAPQLNTDFLHHGQLGDIRLCFQIRDTINKSLVIEGAYMDWDTIGKWILAGVAALAAVGVVLKVAIVRKSRSTTVTQKNNVAGGDIIAGDKIDTKR